MVALAPVGPSWERARPRWSRRRRLLLRMAPLSLLLAVLLVAVPIWASARLHAVVPLGQEGIGIGPAGQVVPLAASDLLVPGSRVLSAEPNSAALAATEQRWLAGGTVPQPAELGSSTMISTALLELKLLMDNGSAPMAGWSGPWRYVWPRDSSFAAVAFARTGHLDEANQILDVLQQVQAPDGTFQARYLPGRAQPPDDRGVQLDGTGWSLWALSQVAARTPVDRRPALIERHRLLLNRSVALITEKTTGASAGGPLPISSDYWETRETKPTLATSAVLLAGLDAAADCYRSVGDPRAVTIAAQAVAFRGRVLAAFGPGFARHLGGGSGSADLGVAFLLPPFTDDAEPATVAGWRRSTSVMARPGGGLAPGGSWKSDGISWTPTTATEAMTAAALGDRAAAVRWLRWLDAHRTTEGSIPEKVLYNGQPAAVAPLAWSAAATVIAADELVGG